MKNYSLADFGKLKRKGKEWLGTCPECHKKHLYVNLDKSVYKCFYAGCGCSGHLIDAACENWKEQKRIFRKQQLKEQPETALAAGGMVKQKNGNFMAPMLPCDYMEVNPEVMERITLITKDMEEKHSSELLPYVSQVIYYLKSRGISLETAEQLRIGAAMHYVSSAEKSVDGKSAQMTFSKEVPCICFLNTVNDRVCTVKYRSVEVKGFSQETAGNSPQPPFNIDCINPAFLNDGEVIDRLIEVEGEQDVMTLRELGYKYVFTLGSSNATPKEYLEAFKEWLEPIRDIILCADTDRPGRTQRMNLQRYFGVKSHIVNLPSDCKDITEVREKYGDDTVRQLINGAEMPANTDIHHVEDYRADVLRMAKGDIDHGYSVGYGPLTDNIFKLYDIGGLIIVSGKPGSGKTDMLDDICCRLMLKRDKHVAFLSFEVPDKAKHIMKMLSKCLGRNNLSLFTEIDLDPYLMYLDSHMVHLTTDMIKATPKNIIGMADIIRKQQPLDFLVVDPYLFIDTETGANTTETQAIKQMLTEFQQWGRKNHVWVFIVAHPRQLQKLSGTNNTEDIDYYTISGSANWANLGDYIFTVARKEAQDELSPIRPATIPPRSITTLKMLKVRDQDYCKPGTVYYLRQSCGRYDEFESEAQVKNAISDQNAGHIDATTIDTIPWEVEYEPF